MSPTANEKMNVSTDLRHPLMHPRWGSGEDLPDNHIIDCSGIDMSKIDSCSEMLSHAQKVFKETGLVLLRNTDLDKLAPSERQLIADWSDAIMGGNMMYDGGANSRRSLDTENVVKNVYDTGAPASANLHYHHEMAYIPKSVESLAFCAVKATPGKGYTWLSDQKACTAHILKTALGKKLMEKGICYVRCLTNKKAYENKEKTWNGIDEVGVYNHWQQSFGVETREEVEEKLKALGPSFKWDFGEQDYLRTKFFVDVYENFEGLNYLYASVADDSLWFDTWHGVSQLPTMEHPKDASMDQRPLKILYGDETEFTREELQEFIEVYDMFGYPVKWEKGDLAVVCNYRWAHGRPMYTLEEGEERELAVILGPQYERRGQTGAWPTDDIADNNSLNVSADIKRFVSDSASTAPGNLTPGQSSINA